MTNVLLDLINKLNSSAFVLVIILIVVGWILFMGGKLVQRFQQHDDCLGRWEDIHKTVTEIKTKVDLIYTNPHPNALLKVDRRDPTLHHEGE